MLIKIKIIKRMVVMATAMVVVSLFSGTCLVGGGWVVFISHGSWVADVTSVIFGVLEAGPIKKNPEHSV